MKNCVNKCYAAMAGGASSADPSQIWKFITNSFGVTRGQIAKTTSLRSARIAMYLCIALKGKVCMELEHERPHA